MNTTYWVLAFLFLLMSVSCHRNAAPTVQTIQPSYSNAEPIKNDTVNITKPLPIKQTPKLPKDRYYQAAYNELSQMLNGVKKSSFKEAVFMTENAYYDGALSHADYDNELHKLVRLATNIRQAKKLLYTYPDSTRLQKIASVYNVFTMNSLDVQDTSEINLRQNFSYDFDDFSGSEDWSKMFVTKLLLTHKGNCHSLPFLYKILVEELGETTYLALAPNHIYLKNYSQKDGWYNTELTSDCFPIDAWLMASGYIHVSAIQNGIYMDTLSTKQSIALCALDLAEGYQRKFGTDSTAFVLKCCDLALQYYPLYINAMILKAETKKYLFQNFLNHNHLSYPAEAFSNPSAKNIFDEMTALYKRVHELGYRKMPDDMYLLWIKELDQGKEKYQNKKINNFK